MKTLSHIIACVWLSCGWSLAGFIINPYMFVVAGGGGSGDPNFANGSLLLHCDGTNASTTFTDSSGYAHTATANGDAQVSTSSPKFGTGAALLDGSGDYLSVPDHSSLDLGAGDFTLEFWLKWTSLSGYQTVYDHGYTASGGIVIQSGNGDGRINLYLNGYYLTAENSALGTGTWGFYQIIRNGSSVAMYRDGVNVGNGTNPASLSSTNTVGIGAKSDGAYAFNGRIDDFRITKGVARAPVVPTAAHPDSAGGPYTYSYVGASYKTYNANSAALPGSTAVSDLWMFSHGDYYDSVPSDSGFAALAAVQGVATNYRADWRKIPTSIPADITLPHYSQGTLFAIRRSAGVPVIVGSNHTYVAANTSITCGSISGSGTLILRVAWQAAGNPTITTPSGWTLMATPTPIWIGGGYHMAAIFQKANDETGVTATVSSTSDIQAALTLLQ